MNNPTLNQWPVLRRPQSVVPWSVVLWSVVTWSVVLWSALPARAQWLSQSIALKTGWNAVYLHVDPSYNTLANTVGADASNPILEVWRWLPAVSTAQFAQSPAQPLDSSQWASWSRNAATTQILQRLIGNSAYLVRSASNYTWTVKGKPLAPGYVWTTTGLNFLGFPTLASNPPTFDTFLAQAPSLQANAEIYYYPGGEMGTNNPLRLYYTRSLKVNRGQAYWIRSGTLYNRYFAPFELVMSGTGLDFGTNLNTAIVRLRNLTANSLTVSLQLLASETPPTGQAAIAGTPPMLVRGAINMTNLTYPCTNLPVGSASSWTLAASGQTGSEVEVVLGLNRSAMTNAPGTLRAGVLRFTDSLGQGQVDTSVSAYAGSTAGLWVGAAAVTQVGAYLNTYARGAANPIYVTNGTTVVTNDLVFTNNGAYVVTSLNTNLGPVPAAYPLRLIIHNPSGSGCALLLQRVFCGTGLYSNSVVATAESALRPAELASARRISAVHLPWSAANTPWSFSGNLGGGSALTATVTDSYKNRGSNPFLHGYHPDHDNLDSTFTQELAQGSESYTIQRQITLQVTPPSSDFASLTAGNQSLTGTYLETIRLLGLARAGGTNDTRSFQVAGAFSLQRISEVTTLTTP